MKIRPLLFVVLLLITIQVGARNTFPKVSPAPQPGYFVLSDKSVVTNLLIDEKDFAVVRITANMLADDIERVTGRKPAVCTSAEKKAGTMVIAGTIGKSCWIDRLVKKKKISVDSLQGKWESFVITTIDHPLPHVKRALVVVGSDRRGTAYGLTSLSNAIGVSPWYWWADVTPRKQASLYVQPGTYSQGEPSVKYRGIFINDERFGGWAKWAEQTFDTQLRQVGPKTYKKVFELLLRLKANYLWPAMHSGTKAFNYYPENAKLADDYAIVMGSSHCEQMLRNNVGEWKSEYGEFNYVDNRDTMLKYWAERLQTNGKYENTYTLGIRGLHDYAMAGATTLQDRTLYTQRALADQRDLLKRYVGSDLTKIPQVFCAYKEVLPVYLNGLRVPDDVTLMWADDNHGFIRQLSTPEEQKRQGGAGVYYHLAYHGDPESWLWLSSISPSLVAYEMTKAYEYGANRIWIFNVGDIKPAEKEITFAMEMAWDINRWNPTNAHEFIEEWATGTFGPEIAPEFASIMSEYYRLAASGKEQHVCWVDYSDQEMTDRLNAYYAISRRTEELAKRVPDHLKAAFYELLYYQVKGATIMNEYFLYARRSLVDITKGLYDEALADSKKSHEAYDGLNAITDQYNKELLGGKWNHYWCWRQFSKLESTSYDLEAATPETIKSAQKLPKPQYINIASKTQNADGSMTYVFDSDIHADSVPVWFQTTTPIRNQSAAAKDNVFCMLSINGHSASASAKPIGNIWHAINMGPLWSKVGTYEIKKGRNVMTISSIIPEATIHSIFIGFHPLFVANPLQRIAAANYVEKHDADFAKIQIVKGLGYNGAVSAFPFTMPSIPDDSIAIAPYVEYSLPLAAGENRIEIRALPTQRIYDGRGVRYAVSVANSEPEIVSIQSDEFTSEWQRNVLRGYTSNYVGYKADKAGTYKVRIYILDAGVALQELLVR